MSSSVLDMLEATTVSGPGTRVNGACAELAERDLASQIMIDPAVIHRVREAVSPADFANPRLATLVSHLFELADEGIDPSDLVSVVAEAERRGRLGRIGGAEAIAEVLECAATSANADVRARQVRGAALEREIVALHSRAARGDRDASTTARLAALESEHAALEGGTGFDSIGFSGERLRRVAERKVVPSPLPGLLDPLPSLHLIAGRPKLGKTRLGLHLTQSWCCGAAPWAGAPALPGTRALVISAEQSVERIYSTGRQLADWNTEQSREDWEERVVIVGRDPEMSPVGRQLLVLDERGLGLLRRVLDQARTAGDPFGFLLLDSLSRLKPRDTDENDNTAMSALLDELQAISVELGVFTLLVHHEGHAERTDPVGAARGASAISAVPQVVMRIAQAADAANRRVLSVAGNEIERDEIEFEVAPESDPGKVYYFSPVDRLAGYDLDALIPGGTGLSLNKIAEKLQGSDGKPSGSALRRARDLVAVWQRAGLVHQDPPLKRGKPGLVRRVS